MSNRRWKRQLVVAVHPSTRGFGYAVFDGPEILVDWGLKGIRSARKNARCLDKIRDLIALYPPDVLVLEDYRGEGSRRGRRIEKLIDAAVELAAEQGIRVATFSRHEVQAAFAKADAETKEEVARAIADEFPELEPRLPPIRKLWMSEDAHMNIPRPGRQVTGAEGRAAIEFLGLDAEPDR